MTAKKKLSQELQKYTNKRMSNTTTPKLYINYVSNQNKQRNYMIWLLYGPNFGKKSYNPFKIKRNACIKRDHLSYLYKYNFYLSGL